MIKNDDKGHSTVKHTHNKTTKHYTHSPYNKLRMSFCNDLSAHELQVFSLIAIGQ